MLDQGKTFPRFFTIQKMIKSIRSTYCVKAFSRKHTIFCTRKIKGCQRLRIILEKVRKEENMIHPLETDTSSLQVCKSDDSTDTRTRLQVRSYVEPLPMVINEGKPINTTEKLHFGVRDFTGEY